ncbi:MAG TPA: glycosyltransferase family 4 protein [Gemmatales bacterium]|nr:glycosyltransferase family 4 protein [Gemmatales bacterium]
MNICLFTNTAFPDMGGQEMVVDELARQYLQAGHQVWVYCPAHAEAAKWDSTSPYPVIRHPRHVSTRWLLSWYAWAFQRLIHRYSLDIVHCHNVYPSAYVALLARKQGKPIVAVTSHGGDVRQENPRFDKPGLRRRHAWVIEQADALISISPFTTEGYWRLGAFPERIHQIPNGVHVSDLSTPVNRPDTLPSTLQTGRFHLFLGRLAHRKGVDVLLHAISLLQNQGQAPWSLAIGGDGPERDALQQLAQKLGLQANTHFLGKVQGDTKRWLLQNAACIIMPTREWEALPMVLLEAHAAGCPVIASDAPGLLGLVEEGVTGWVVPRDNHITLAERIQFVQHLSHQQRQHVGLQGKQKSHQFNWPYIAQQHVSLFERLLHMPRKQAA